MIELQLNNLVDKCIPTDYEQLRQIARNQFILANQKEIIRMCIRAYALKLISEYREPKKKRSTYVV